MELVTDVIFQILLSVNNDLFIYLFAKSVDMKAGSHIIFNP